MTAGSFRFERFLLDPRDRQLRRDDAPVELSTRYLDALALLVREQGRLVSKTRFHEEVWRGAPVTDEALTQCIRTIRRQLGDDAAQPRFIETVPKHGYRFIAQVEWVAADGGREASPLAGQRRRFDWSRFLALGGAGTLGGGAAGLLGGLFYGFVGASEPLQPGVGAVSVLLVMVCVTVAMALIGGAGVGFGVAWASVASGRCGRWCVAGGAAGGLVVGGLVKLVGTDAFALLFGQSPGDITGAPEGLLLGGAVGLGVWAASRARGPQALARGMAAAALASAAAGVAIVLLGGRLMGGSLDLLAHRFPNSRLRLGQVGALFGENGFGPLSHLCTAGLEGLLFGACLVGAMKLAQRRLDGGQDPAAD